MHSRLAEAAGGADGARQGCVALTRDSPPRRSARARGAVARSRRERTIRCEAGGGTLPVAAVAVARFTSGALSLVGEGRGVVDDLKSLSASVALFHVVVPWRHRLAQRSHSDPENVRVMETMRSGWLCP